MPNHCDAPLPDTHSRCRRRVTQPGQRCHLHPRITFTSLTGPTQQHPYLHTQLRVQLAPGAAISLENLTSGRVQVTINGPLAVELAAAITTAYTITGDI